MMNASDSPIKSPPSIAPGIEPIPPTTAAVKPFSPADEAHQVVDLVEHEPDHHAGRARERRADEKGRDDHPVDVDSLHRGGLAVEGSGAHRLAEPRSRTSSVRAIISAADVRITMIRTTEMLQRPPVDAVERSMYS